MAKCQPAWGVCRVSEYTVIVSILTAMLALLYLISVRLGNLNKDISCLHESAHTVFDMFFANHDELPKGQPESETPAPFKDWDES